MIFVGVDWAEAHHDVHVEDEDGRRLGGWPAARGRGGDRPFPRAGRRACRRAREVIVGIETDRGLFVARWWPRATSCSR